MKILLHADTAALQTVSRQQKLCLNNFREKQYQPGFSPDLKRLSPLLSFNFSQYSIGQPACTNAEQVVV